MTSTTIGIRLAHRSQRVLAAVLSYLWSGWGAIASLLLFCALWEWGLSTMGAAAARPQATMLQLLRCCATVLRWSRCKFRRGVRCMGWELRCWPQACWACWRDAP